MQDPMQGAVQGTPSAEPLVQGADLSAPSAAEGQTVDTPSAVPQGQGAVDVERLLRGVQGSVDSLRAQVLQQQQFVSQLAQQAAPQVQQNPYDPQTQPNEWWTWRDQRYAEMVAQKTEERLVGALSSVAKNQAEVQWQNAHPRVNIADVKAFAETRKIGNLDDAYTLMTLPQAQAQQAAGVFNQFQRPQNAATPLQGSQGGAQQEMQGRFDKDYLEFAQTNGRAYDTWSPERRLAFDTEHKRREAERTAVRR